MYPDEPAQVHRGVDADPAERVDGFHKFELQQRVHQVGDFGEVVEEIGDSLPHDDRQHELVAANDRQEDVIVEDGVEDVNPAVHRLPGVVGVDRVGDVRFDVFYVVSTVCHEAGKKNSVTARR